MSKLKALGSCLGTFLIGSLVVGAIGAVILAIFPSSTKVVTSIGGFMVLILIWNAVDTLLKTLKQKGDASAPVQVKPAEPEKQG